MLLQTARTVVCPWVFTDTGSCFALRAKHLEFSGAGGPSLFDVFSGSVIRVGP